MKSFFKTFFASLLGIIVGSILITILSIAVIAGVITSMNSSSDYVLKDKTILKLDLNGALNDRSSSNPLDILSDTKSLALDDIIQAINNAKENDEVKGIYIKAGNFGAAPASLNPIRKALLDFKGTGKFVVAYGDNYTQGAYYIASVADKVIMNPKGMLDFHGMSSQPMFVKGMYEKLGVKYQVFKVGTFKSAVEPYIQDKMSDANREQVSSYLNDIWSHLLTGISESRNISMDQLNTYADECLMFSDADTIVKYNMVDTLMYVPAVEEYLKGLTETPLTEKLNIASVSNIASLSAKDKNTEKDIVAVLYAEGVITDDESAGLFSSGSSITAKVYVKELQKLKNDSTVKAVVFRVNSPGGSAYASEQIWESVEELKKVKPVIVSMGDYAASGGYYISCAATSIIAEPTTLTGSIGIFGLLPEGEELAKKIGVSFDQVSTNKHSDFGGTTFGIPFLLSAQSRSLTPEEGQMFQKYINKGYDLFITRCAEGRSKTKEEIDQIGQGRVWTGSQALERGLVDKLGGLDDAIKLAAEKADLKAYKTNNYPAKKDVMTELINNAMGGAKLKAVKTWMGEEEYKIKIMENTLKSTDLQMAAMPDRVIY